MPDPVLVVGAGPTGLTAALELSRFGIPVRIVDKLPEPATTSRALGVQARTLELMEVRGLADELVRRGHPVKGMSLHGGGKRIAGVDLSSIDSRYAFVLILPQSETEAVLREALESKGVTVERGVELVAIAQDAGSQEASPVSAVLRHADGRLEDARAPWLIGAEGAHSVVRRTLALPFEGKTREQHYALGDIRYDGPLDADHMHVFTSSNGLFAIFPFGGGRIRIVTSYPAREDTSGAPTLPELQAMYDDSTEMPGTLSELGWSSWFRINSRMVGRLRVGRLIVGGDAAHIHSPAGGQGMNTGIQDMLDLCWKMAFAMKHGAPDALVDLYETERLPIMRDVLSKTERLTDIVDVTNPVLRGVVDHLAPWIVGSAAVSHRAGARVSQISLGCRESPMSQDHDRAGGLKAGDRLPDRVVARVGADETPLFALLDPCRFVVLTHGLRDIEADAVAAALQPWSDVMSIAPIAAPADPAAAERFHEDFGAAGGIHVVRPDGYLGFVGAPRSAKALAAWCARWLGERPAAA